MTPSQREYSIASGPDGFKNQLLKQFPDEVKGIETFFTLLKKAYKPQGSVGWFALKLLPLWLVNALNFLGLPTYLNSFYSLSHRSTKDVVEVNQQANELLPQIIKFYLPIIDNSLKSLTKNKDLQFLLSYSTCGFCLPPSQVSFSMIALLHAHCCENGEYRLLGKQKPQSQIQKFKNELNTTKTNCFCFSRIMLSDWWSFRNALPNHPGHRAIRWSCFDEGERHADSNRRRKSDGCQSRQQRKFGG